MKCLECGAEGFYQPLFGKGECSGNPLCSHYKAPPAPPKPTLNSLAQSVRAMTSDPVPPAPIQLNPQHFPPAAASPTIAQQQALAESWLAYFYAHGIDAALLGGCHVSWALGAPAKDLDIYVTSDAALSLPKVIAAATQPGNMWRPLKYAQQKHIVGVFDAFDQGTRIQIVRVTCSRAVDAADFFDFSINKSCWTPISVGISKAEMCVRDAILRKELVVNLEDYIGSYDDHAFAAQSLVARSKKMLAKCGSDFKVVLE